MRRPGVLALPASAAVAAALLAGCTKPTPAVTIQSGGTSLRSEAVNYQLDGKTVTNTAGVKVLTVPPGGRVNISVDKTTAQAGWVVLLGGQQISPLLTKNQHHFAFQLSPTFQANAEATLAVFQQGPVTGSAAGAWLFTIREGF